MEKSNASGESSTFVARLMLPSIFINLLFLFLSSFSSCCFLVMLVGLDFDHQLRQLILHVSFQHRVSQTCSTDFELQTAGGFLFVLSFQHIDCFPLDYYSYKYIGFIILSLFFFLFDIKVVHFVIKVAQFHKDCTVQPFQVIRWYGSCN